MPTEWSKQPPEGRAMFTRLISARHYYEDCAARAQSLLDNGADPKQVDEAFEVADLARRELESVRRIIEYWQRQLCDVVGVVPNASLWSYDQAIQGGDDA